MRHANNEKRKTTHDGRDGTRKSIKNQRKGNVQILGNIGSRHHQTSVDEKKKIKKSISGERESYLKPNYIAGTVWKG